MKRIIQALLIVFIILLVSGCGSSNPPPSFVSNILSNPLLDGDIERTSTSDIVTQRNLPSEFAGIDPVTGSETRAFLQFSLASIPLNAVISSATLDIFINSIRPLIGTIPMRIDLVSFEPRTTLIPGDFDRITLPPQVSIPFPIFQSDLGRHVIIDVTAFMQRAQTLGLARFQVRLLEDLGIVSPGLIEIDDATVARAPLLQVIYF